MYRAGETPAPLREDFSSLAWWTPETSARTLLLAADPGFEIAWSSDGRSWLMPATLRSRVVTTEGSPLAFLRFRPEAVGAWLGADVAELVDGPSVPLDALGSRWRDVARAETEAARIRALGRMRGEAVDPLAQRSLAILRAPRAPSFAEIAAAEGYSYEQWLRRMKRATGVSPRFFVGYHALRRAARLARERPTASMGEVAFRTGFASDSALAASAVRLSGRTFRALVGGFTLPE